MNGLAYAILGGVLSALIFYILIIIFGSNEQGFIFAGVITLSMIICGCTGIIVDVIKGKRDEDEEV
ncbi:MAG: hypothetical protein Q8920_12650 [Bacillota bacterium]|nr:hypothetical protein [Bacillota bacterium]